MGRASKRFSGRAGKSRVIEGTGGGQIDVPARL